MFCKAALTNIISMVCKPMGYYSDNACNQLLGIAAQESTCGKNLKQIGGGPARGIWGIELITENDTWENYLIFRPFLISFLMTYTGVKGPSENDLMYNHLYGAALARIILLRKPGEIPGDLLGQSQYWKAHWNTKGGKGTVGRYIENWNLYMVT